MFNRHYSVMASPLERSNKMNKNLLILLVLLQCIQLNKGKKWAGLTSRIFKISKITEHVNIIEASS